MSAYEGENNGGGPDSGNGLDLPNWITKYSGTLRAFGKSPAGFILGAVVSTILGGVETIVEAFIDAILFVFLGSDNTPSATGTLGIADVPVFVGDKLAAGGEAFLTGVGDTPGVFDAIRAVNRAAVEAAAAAGPLSPILYAALLAAALIVTAWTLRTAIGVLADAIPGVQGLL